MTVDELAREGTLPLWQDLRGQGLVRPDDILTFLGVEVPPVDVWAIANRLGVVIQEVEPIGWSGAVDSRTLPARIFLDRKDAPTRKRFTIAHELGHLMVHEPGQAYRDLDFRGHDRKEMEANQFAAELLMPKWMLSIALESTGGSVQRLARLFQVSSDATTVRLGNLGLLGGAR